MILMALCWREQELYAAQLALAKSEIAVLNKAAEIRYPTNSPCMHARMVNPSPPSPHDS